MTFAGGALRSLGAKAKFEWDLVGRRADFPDPGGWRAACPRYRRRGNGHDLRGGAVFPASAS